MKKIAILFSFIPTIIAIIIPRITSIDPETLMIYMGTIWAAAWPPISLISLVIAHHCGLEDRAKNATDAILKRMMSKKCY